MCQPRNNIDVVCVHVLSVGMKLFMDAMKLCLCVDYFSKENVLGVDEMFDQINLWVTLRR